MAKAKFNQIYKRLCRLLAEARKKAALQQFDVIRKKLSISFYFWD